MKILLVSDTHRFLDHFQTVLERVGKVDRILHMGDMEEEQKVIHSLVDCPMHFVAGNNDFFVTEKLEREFTLEGIRIFMTHGHYYGVSMGLNRLADEARARGAQVALFGHTHRPIIEYREGLVLVNPGSLSYPRQPNRKPSYAIMEIDEKQEAHFTINYLE